MKPNTTRLVNTAYAFLLVTFLTACASQSRQEVGVESFLPNIEMDNVLPAEVNEVLSTTSQELSIAISSGSMQGKSLVAGPVYFSASGRFCRKAHIVDSLLEERYVACRMDSGSWVLIRAVI